MSARKEPALMVVTQEETQPQDDLPFLLAGRCCLVYGSGTGQQCGMGMESGFAASRYRI